MLIIGDETRRSGFPWMTVLLVVANCAVFHAQVRFGEPIVYGYCLVPQEILQGKDIVGPTPITVHECVEGPTGQEMYRERTVVIPHQPGPKPIYLTVLTSMFLHGSLLHLIGNMMFLLVFGRNVERALGPVIFLIFYLLCGAAAGMTHVFVAPESVAPCMGASGAISGVMGAYFFIFPFNWVKVWLIFCVIDLPSIIILGGWIVLQYLESVEAIRAGDVYVGVAYWVHVGGFLAGIVFVLTLLMTLRVLTVGTRDTRRRLCT